MDRAWIGLRPRCGLRSRTAKAVHGRKVSANVKTPGSMLSAPPLAVGTLSISTSYTRKTKPKHPMPREIIFAEGRPGRLDSGEPEESDAPEPAGSETYCQSP